MKKRGLSKIKVIIGILSLIIVIISFIVVSSRFEKTGLEKGIDFQSTDISIIPDSVFVSKEHDYLMFNITQKEISGEISGIYVVVKDEKNRSYEEEIKYKLENTENERVIINYSGEGLGEIKEFSIISETLSEKNSQKNDNARKTIVLRHLVKKNNFYSISCNNNGILEIGEVCDDGNLNNNDKCLNNCNIASCGDGFVWNSEEGAEECDDGAENSNTLPDRCRKDCTLPKCGDKVIDSGERCDGINLGEYGDGMGKCKAYDSRYEGNLKCDNCKISLEECYEVIRALKFNGINESIDIRLVLNRSKGYTVSAWVKPEAIDSKIKAIFDCENSWISMKIINKNYIFRSITKRNGNWTEKISITPSARKGKWAHVVGVHDLSGIKIYVDGSLRDAQSQTGKIYRDIGCRIGSYKDEDINYFKGILDDIRVYDRALESTEIIKLYKDGQNGNSVTKNLVGWWKFDENDGRIANDSSGNNNHGSLIGYPEWVTEISDLNT